MLPHRLLRKPFLAVGGFLTFTTVLRTISYLPFTLLCCSASFAVKKLPPALFIVTMITLLPYVLVYMGFSKMMYVGALRRCSPAASC